MKLYPAQMSLSELWEGAAGNPYTTIVSKDNQFFVGFTLLVTGKRTSPTPVISTADPMSQL